MFVHFVKRLLKVAVDDECTDLISGIFRSRLGADWFTLTFTSHPRLESLDDSSYLDVSYTLLISQVASLILLILELKYIFTNDLQV